MKPARGRWHRRSATLVMYWRAGGAAVAYDYALGSERVLDGAQLSLLMALGPDWQHERSIARSMRGIGRKAVIRNLGQLHEWGLIEASDEPLAVRRVLLRQWSTWSPDAAFFHFASKDGEVLSHEAAERLLDLQTILRPPPPPLKTAGAAKPLPLPPYPRTGAFSRVLLERRSWRRFGAGPLSLRHLSTLLGLTWGVQHWMHVAGGMQCALKTSPSGGACHPLEVYVIAQKVSGLSRGIYHYDPDRHALRAIRAGLRRNAVSRFLRQPWFAGCAAAFVMTAVWPRVQWKYPFPRAYRTVLLEAGHFAQTFCLAATALRLAPFCTGAFADSDLERALRVDGVTEGVVYVTGVGARPKGARWAPWPEAADIPRTTLPAHREKGSAHA